MTNPKIKLASADELGTSLKEVNEVFELMINETDNILNVYYISKSEHDKEIGQIQLKQFLFEDKSEFEKSVIELINLEFQGELVLSWRCKLNDIIEWFRKNNYVVKNKLTDSKEVRDVLFNRKNVKVPVYIFANLEDATILKVNKKSIVINSFNLPKELTEEEVLKVLTKSKRNYTSMTAIDIDNGIDLYDLSSIIKENNLDIIEI